MATADTLRAWTIQSEDWWTNLQRDGTIAADPSYIYPPMVPPYEWLRTQMRRRIPTYNGAWPIWFWAHPKPDLRSRGHVERGASAVRLELEIPRERALLLDFETWHCVLNGFHLSDSEDDTEDWYRRTDGCQKLTPEQQHELESTWERVFDLPWLRERAGYWGGAQRIQGVIDSISMSHVRCVQRFRGR